MAGTKATIHLRVLGQSLSASLELPGEAIPASGILPAARAIADAVAGVASNAAAACGRRVTCRNHCSACCRQMVTLAPVEAIALDELVSQMPASRQQAVRQRFAGAIAAVRREGLIEATSADHEPILSAGSGSTEESRNARLDAYFDLQIPCPFLEGDVCGIYHERPLICREYMVTSPVENCSKVGRLPTIGVPLPVYVSDKLMEMGCPEVGSATRIPLIFALAWSDAHRHEYENRYEPQVLLAELLKLLDVDALIPFAQRVCS